MVRRKSRNELIRELEDKYTNELSLIFIEVIKSITDNIVLSEIVTAIQARNFEKAIQAMNIDEAAFRPMARAMEMAFEDAGNTIARNLPRSRSNGITTVFRFNIRNKRAETWLQQASSQLVTRLTDDSRAAVRAALRDGAAQGLNPRNVALDIVGRIDPITGNRVGGIIGLNGPQERWLAATRQELNSTDPKLLNNYLKRQLRDRRFDKYVKEALKTGEKIPANIVSKMTGRYSDRLLKARGDTVSRSEMIETMNNAQQESYKQAIEKGTINKKDVKKEWDSSGDARVRESHNKLNGVTVDFDQPFISPDTGGSMMFPGDTSLGAPGEDVINCRCRVKYKVDFFAGVK